MSLKYRDSQGNEAPVAGLNGTSGELVPSVALMQSGTITIPQTSASGHGTIPVTFNTPMPDTDYTLNFEITGNSWYTITVQSDKTANGFTVIYQNVDKTASSGSATVKWTAFKLMTDESRALDEQAIAQNTSDISGLQDDAESIQAVIPSKASSTNKLALRSEIYILSNQYRGATYTTVEALLEKVAADMLAKGGYGGAVGCVWTGKSYFSGTYGTNGSTAGNARLHFENAQDGYTECTFNFTSSGLGTVNWFNDVTTSTVTSGSTAPITSGAVAAVKETAEKAATDSYLARGEIGDITALETTDQSDLVSAINELVHRINAL